MAEDGAFGRVLLAALQALVLQNPSAGSSLYDYVALVEELVRDQVCLRCILRVFQHTRFSDYLLPAPPAPAVLASLRQAVARPPGQAAAPGQPDLSVEGVAAAGGDGAAGQDASATPGTATSVAAAPGLGSIPAWPSVCGLCLGLIQALSGDMPKHTVAPVEQPLVSVRVPAISADVLTQVLQVASLPQFESLDLDVCIPAAVLLRERMLESHLAPRWKALVHRGKAQFVPIQNVVRRLLIPQVTALLGSGCQWRDGNAEVTLVVDAEYTRDKDELRPLVLEGVQFQHNRKQSRRREPFSSTTPPGKRVRHVPPMLQERPSGDGVGVNNAPREHAASGVDQDATSAAAGAHQPAEAPAAPTAASDAAGDGGRRAGGCDGDDGDAVSREADRQLCAMPRARMASLVAAKPADILARVLAWPPRGEMARPEAVALSVRLIRPSVLLAGRYVKAVRGTPQTKWVDPDTGQRIGGVSLAEHIQDALAPLYLPDDFKFITGGREDADVRMLGEGRPFVLEVKNPKLPAPTAEQLRAVEQQLESAEHGARALALKPCTPASLEKIKEAEESKEKTYSALCWADKPLDDSAVEALRAVVQLNIEQDTPLRVLHRRAPKVRTRWVTVEDVTVVPLKPCYFNLTLRTQAGTYVKEFCHGDLGRTQPNLGTLLNRRTEILQLDVLAVHMPDWP